MRDILLKQLYNLLYGFRGRVRCIGNTNIWILASWLLCKNFEHRQTEHYRYLEATCLATHVTVQ